MTQARQNIRKTILVERGTQFRFARFVLMFAVGTALVTSAVVFVMTFSLFGERLRGVYPEGRLLEVFRTAYMWFGIIILASVPVIFYLSVRFSHRFVGPLPKIYRILRGVGKGDFEQEVKLRKNDELKELASVINEMIRDLKASKETNANQ